MKYRFNVGDAVVQHIRGPGVVSDEPVKIVRARGCWCWVEGAGDHDWNAFHRNSGNQRENPIPGFFANITVSGKCGRE